MVQNVLEQVASLQLIQNHLLLWNMKITSHRRSLQLHLTQFHFNAVYIIILKSHL